jgi:rhamnose transport system permease protein
VRAAFLARAVAYRNAALVVLLAAMVALAVRINPTFASWQNTRDLLDQVARVVIVGCGMTMVVIAGEIDISVGSLLGLLAALMGVLSAPDRLGLPLPIVITLTILAGTAVGLINGLVVTLGRVPSIIATLGMLTLLRGATDLVMAGTQITDLPASLRWLGLGTSAGVSVSVWVSIAVVAASWTILQRTPTGVRLYAVGGNPEAAALARVSSARIKILAFTLTGFLTAVAALVTVPQQSVIEAGIGRQFELVVVTAVVVGGTSFRGGYGGISGTILAALLLGSIRTILVFVDRDDRATYWERAIQGGFILAAVLADHAAARASGRRVITASDRTRVRAPSLVHEGVLAALVVVVMALAWTLDPSFVAPGTQLELSRHAADLALLALPMTLIIISGGIDLSVGSIMAIAGVVFGLFFKAGAPVGVAAVAALATGAAAGALNGLFVSRIGVHPLIVTLATYAAFRGLAEGVSHGAPASGFPPGFLSLGDGAALGVPIQIIMVAVGVIAAAVVAARTTLGFRIYAIGDNEGAARYAAIPVRWVKFVLYSLSGAVAGLAAVLYAAHRNTAKADIGEGIELEVITAVVLGGTSMFGGRGTILGTVFGVTLIHELREFISWHWHKDELILIVIGSILIAAVLLNNLASRRRS